MYSSFICTIQSTDTSPWLSQQPWTPVLVELMSGTHAWNTTSTIANTYYTQHTCITTSQQYITSPTRHFHIHSFQKQFAAGTIIWHGRSFHRWTFSRGHGAIPVVPEMQCCLKQLLQLARRQDWCLVLAELPRPGTTQQQQLAMPAVLSECLWEPMCTQGSVTTLMNDTCQTTKDSWTHSLDLPSPLLFILIAGNWKCWGCIQQIHWDKTTLAIIKSQAAM